MKFYIKIGYNNFKNSNYDAVNRRISEIKASIATQNCSKHLHDVLSLISKQNRIKPYTFVNMPKLRIKQKCKLLNLTTQNVSVQLKYWSVSKLKTYYIRFIPCNFRRKLFILSLANSKDANTNMRFCCIPSKLLASLRKHAKIL